MKKFNFILKNDNKPLYLRIADSIETSILDGLLLPEESLPSLREMAKICNCHKNTVSASYSELVARGVIYGEQRKAFKVCKMIRPNSEISQKSSLSTGLSKTDYNLNLDFSNSKKEFDTNVKHHFYTALPDMRIFPKDSFRGSLSESIKRLGDSFFNYTSAFGHPPLIKELEIYLRRYRQIKDRKILITSGSQEAIFIIGQMFLSKGDVVLVEEVGYPPAWDALGVNGAKLVSLPMDKDGIILEEFEKLVKTHRPKLLYLTPSHQFPTYQSLCKEKRKRIYEISQEFNILILENDYNFEFQYTKNIEPAMAGSDPNELVLYVSSFSKALFPSVRCGFLVVPEKVYIAISELKNVISRNNDAILQDAIARWMREKYFESHLKKMTKNYKERRGVMANFLKNYDVSFNLPSQGMALWVDMKVDSKKLAQLAKKEGVGVAFEEYFRFEPLLAKKSTFVRLGFSNQNSKEIVSGLEILMGLRNRYF